jgi:Cof subfamily protein (haloacid dehalogenase superfamily)
VESLHEVADAYPVDKLLTAGDPAYLQAHYEEMYAPFTQTLSGMFTADWYFEYTAPGIDKARALEGALPKLGIDASEVVSFGDGQNDKSMIEWAGTGVAMGNAVDEVKAVAQMVTANNNEDGIAVALDKLLG